MHKLDRKIGKIWNIENIYEILPVVGVWAKLIWQKNTNGNWREFFISNTLPCLQQSVLEKGLKALDLTLDFDEMAVLNENKTYIVNTLDVSV